MSWEACTWASKQNLPSLQKLVLIMLANHANGDTGQCNPSHGRLAERCGMSVTTVKKMIFELEKSGKLRIEHRSIERVNLSNQYILAIPVYREATEGGSGDDLGVGRHATTKQEAFKQEIETKKDSSKTKNKKASRGDVTLREYLEVTPDTDWAPPGGKAYRHMETAEIPVTWLRLAVRAFSEEFIDNPKKKYTDWVAAFANYVVKGWLHLWFFDVKSNQWALTSQGMAYQIKVNGGTGNG